MSYRIMGDRKPSLRFAGSILLMGGIMALLALNASANAESDNYTYIPSTDAIVNPERGIYGWGPLEDTTHYNSLRASGVSLCYSNITLDDYRTSNIAPVKLTEITNAFNRMRTAGMKGIVRINYNEDGGDDTTLAWMEIHLQQLQPILNANADVIAFFQAGMMGAWGEWHSSSSGLDNPAGRSAVWNLLLTYLPACKFIQVRTPAYVYELEGAGLPLSATTAFSCTGASRIAHHNDCWLASSTDYGTYPTNPIQREMWKSRIANDTRYVPWGAETCNLDPTYANCINAVSEAERFHANFLNRDYEPNVIAVLVSNGCWDTLVNNLGYRLELLSASLPSQVTAGYDFDFSIELQNVGWAPLYNERPVFLRLFSGSTVVQDYELTEVDPRWWSPEEGLITISGTLTAPALISFATVGFALWMPDQDTGLRFRSEYSVHFANESVWDDFQGHNILADGIPVISGVETPTPPASPTATSTPTLTPTSTLTSTPTSTFTPTSSPTHDPNCSSATYFDIGIDGDFADWISVPLAFSDPDGDRGSAVADITNVYIANNTEYLFLRIQTSAAEDFSGNSHTNLFFDTDLNSSTGFTTHGVGSEFLIQGSGGYDERGGGFNEGTVSMNFVAAPSGAVTDVELRIARSSSYDSDSAPVFTEPEFVFLITANSVSWSAEDFAPDAPGGFLYEFACEPQSSVAGWTIH